MDYSARLFSLFDNLKQQKRINTYVELAEIIGTNKSGINDLKTEKKKVTLDHICSMIKSYPDINLDWFISGEGEMFKTSHHERKNTSYQEVSTNEVSLYQLKTDYYSVEKQQIPLYEIEASAGLSTLFSNQNSQVPLDFISVPNAPKCDGAVYVRGDSMYPILKSGDIVCYKMIQDINDAYWGEMYLLDIDVSGDQYLTFKYVQKSDLGDDYIRLVSHNNHHNPKDVLKKNIRALALVKISIRYNTIS
ncbi:S24 family peptidase [Dysgonomonas sp. ZJ709]|uniref:S24 family peptidase n=1 Tax=Dysgonomonas sp. ZJ709 TaxID=2709797 RepID=UPI0013E9FCD4|nr:S24 family peptidase [Dysgonomonas sp. ZJ709]